MKTLKYVFQQVNYKIRQSVQILSSLLFPPKQGPLMLKQDSLEKIFPEDLLEFLFLHKNHAFSCVQICEALYLSEPYFQDCMDGMPTGTICEEFATSLIQNCISDMFEDQWIQISQDVHDGANNTFEYKILKIEPTFYALCDQMGVEKINTSSQTVYDLLKCPLFISSMC